MGPRKRQTAQVVSRGAKHPPTLTPGPVTPELLLLWEHQCKYHFIAKRIKDDDRQVVAAASGLQDPAILTWYFTHADALTARGFAGFMHALKRRFLGPDWADAVLCRIVNSHQGEGESLERWIRDLTYLNVLLSGTTSRLSDDSLRHHISTHAVKELRLLAHQADVCALADFEDFTTRLVCADQRRLFENAKYSREVGAFLSGQRPSNSKAAPNNMQRIPPLTDAERTLLRANNGCFRCRQFHVGHGPKECTAGFPDPADYKGVPYVSQQSAIVVPTVCMLDDDSDSDSDSDSDNDDV